jgi:hypothetical protein
MASHLIDLSVMAADVLLCKMTVAAVELTPFRLAVVSTPPSGVSCTDGAWSNAVGKVTVTVAVELAATLIPAACPACANFGLISPVLSNIKSSSRAASLSFT